MDEYGYVIDLELAKNILIMYFANKYILELDLCEQIKNELIHYDEGYTFDTPNGPHFGGPEGSSGYVIQTLDGWLKEHPENLCFSASQTVCLNQHNGIFYKIKDKLTYFVLGELD